MTSQESGGGLVQVSGYPLAVDRAYEPATHMWVLRTSAGVVRIGMDPLGIETSGTLAQLSFAPVGTDLAAGQPFGQLEAAKFVGPLISPVSGTLLAINEAAAADPGLAERDPFGDGWLAEVGVAGPAAGLPGLLSGPAEITAWFAAKVAEYQAKGVLAQ